MDGCVIQQIRMGEAGTEYCAGLFDTALQE
jgi:hypothetical protein